MFKISCQITMSRFIKVLPVVAVLIAMGVMVVPTLGADGACCSDGGNCTTVADQDACNALFGNAFVDGSPCTAPQACCEDEGGEPTGECSMEAPECCEAYGSTVLAGETCAGVREACCLPDGTCDMGDPLCCGERGGVSQGAGSNCDAPELCRPVPAVSELGMVVMVLLLLAAGTVVISKRRALRTAA